MDVGYLGIDSAIDASKNGAPLYMAAANHLGGSRYLVVSNDITDPEQLKGQKLAIGGESVKYRPEWHTWQRSWDCLQTRQTGNMKPFPWAPLTR